MDLSVFKNTAISERLNLQFRAEIFQSAQPREFRHAQRDGIFGTGVNASAGLITTTDHDIPADSIRIETDLLIGAEWRPIAGGYRCTARLGARIAVRITDTMLTISAPKNAGTKPVDVKPDVEPADGDARRPATASFR